jgi:RimJ/RimL family protein N-acetyltransferase
MAPLPFLEEPLIADDVVVRDGDERDIPEILIAYQDDPELHLRMGEDRPPSGAELGSRAENEYADRATGVHATLTIIEPGADICRGQIYVHHIEWEHMRAELGIWLAPQFRGRGLGSRALALVATWLIKTCGFKRVEVLTESDNVAMVHSAQAAGFAFEGVLRRYMREHGRRIDAAVLSILRSDMERS